MVLSKQLNVLHNKDMPIILIQLDKEVHRGYLSEIKDFSNKHENLKNAYVGDVDIIVKENNQFCDKISRIVFKEPLLLGVPYLIIKIKNKTHSVVSKKEVE